MMSLYPFSSTFRDPDKCVSGAHRSKPNSLLLDALQNANRGRAAGARGPAPEGSPAAPTQLHMSNAHADDRYVDPDVAGVLTSGMPTPLSYPPAVPKTWSIEAVPFVDHTPTNSRGVLHRNILEGNYRCFRKAGAQWGPLEAAICHASFDHRSVKPYRTAMPRVPRLEEFARLCVLSCLVEQRSPYAPIADKGRADSV